MVCVWTPRIFSKTDVSQQLGRMPANLALSGVCGLAFAVKLNERADQSRVLFRRDAVIAFERRNRLGGDIGSSGCQFRIHCITEVLRASFSVCEICDAFQIETAAVTRRNRTKRSVGFADNIEPASQFAIA